MLTRAEKKAIGKGDIPTNRRSVLPAGISVATTLLENKKAQLAVIACDEDPLKLVVFPSALCYKMGFSYHSKGKARWTPVPGKICLTVAFIHINLEDKGLSWWKL